jgi:hypothetical protein
MWRSPFVLSAPEALLQWTASATTVCTRRHIAFRGPNIINVFKYGVQLIAATRRALNAVFGSFFNAGFFVELLSALGAFQIIIRHFEKPLCYNFLLPVNYTTNQNILTNSLHWINLKTIIKGEVNKGMVC